MPCITVRVISGDGIPPAAAGRTDSSRSIRSPGCSIPDSEFTSSTEIVIARMPGRTRLEIDAVSALATDAGSKGSPARIGTSRRAPTRASKRAGTTAPPGVNSRGIERTAIVSGPTGSPRRRSRRATTTSSISWRGCSLAFSSARRSAM